ncbi:hypothetical protein [uncultured Shewanella sp.]|uniref:hypothetical protein n=1 Tax=uncultured Shewanella sp. TaxID=173975 RepID=UPI002630500F|nr:hypothetical protein [uncultured Shewanella sp.]
MTVSNNTSVTDTFDQLIELSIEKMAEAEQAEHPYKNATQIKAQLTQNVSHSMQKIQINLSRSIELCQAFLSQEHIQRIFLPILKAYNSSPEAIEQGQVTNAKLTNEEYELILSIAEQVYQNQSFDDAISVCSLLELLKPEDIRAYIQHACALEAQGDIAATTQYYQNMTQALNNPVLNFHAAQYLLNIGQTFDAKEKLNQAIHALNSANTDSPECAEFLIMLQTFKNEHQLN